MIRLAREEDFDSILAVYEAARRYMAQNGNPSQWGSHYPEPSTLQNDISKKQLFVVEEEGHIGGVFMFHIGPDASYANIFDGAWTNDEPYGVIHRVAADGRMKGVFSRCAAFCKSQIPSLRIDTHSDNLTMRHLIEKHGFERCGIIYVEDGSPRIAYQYSAAL